MAITVWAHKTSNERVTRTTECIEWKQKERRIQDYSIILELQTHKHITT